jgi:glycosyltransferase involved in cell wall biosynthesis
MDQVESSSVLIVSQVPPPVNGSTRMTELIIDVISELGHEPTLVEKRFSRHASEVGVGSFRKILLVPGLLTRLVQAICRRKPAACIYFLTNRKFSFAVDYVMLRIISLLGIKTILYLHTNGYSQLASSGRLASRLLKDVFSAADKVVTLSDSLRADVSPFLEHSKASVIPNAVLDPFQAGEVHLGNDILFLSNLIPSKGAHEFILMASSLASKRKSLKFHVVGAISDPQYAASLTKLITELNVGDRVTLHGALYGDDLEVVRRQCSLLVFPSTYEFEALPLAAIESLSLGMPVAAYNVGGLGDLISDDCGYLADVPEIQLLEAFVDRYVDDPALRSRLSDGARRSFERQFGLDVFASRWARVLDSTQITHEVSNRSVGKHEV